MLAALAAAAVIFIVIIVIIVLQDDERPAPVGPLPARALVAIDVSLSMACPVELNRTCTKAMRQSAAEEGGLTRISAARTFAGGGVRDLSLADDELGIWTFTTSTDGGRLSHARPTFAHVLELGRVASLGSSVSAAFEVVEQRLGNVHATAGGGPLLDLIDAGIDRLRRAPSNGAVNTLVVITDGQENASVSTTLEDLTRKVDEGYARKPVRILITATGDARCERYFDLVDASDGDCFPGGTEDALRCASQNIRSQLRLAHPAKPRSRKQKESERAC